MDYQQKETILMPGNVNQKLRKLFSGSARLTSGYVRVDVEPVQLKENEETLGLSRFISGSKWEALWMFWEWGRQTNFSVANINNAFLSNIYGRWANSCDPG